MQVTTGQYIKRLFHRHQTWHTVAPKGAEDPFDFEVTRSKVTETHGLLNILVSRSVTFEKVYPQVINSTKVETLYLSCLIHQSFSKTQGLIGWDMYFYSHAIPFFQIVTISDNKGLIILGALKIRDASLLLLIYIIDLW